MHSALLGVYHIFRQPGSPMGLRVHGWAEGSDTQRAVSNANDLFELRVKRWLDDGWSGKAIPKSTNFSD